MIDEVDVLVEARATSKDESAQRHAPCDCVLSFAGAFLGHWILDK